MTGSLEIVGSLDTSLIERGFARVSQGFDSVKGRADSFNSDLDRMGISAGKVASGLIGLGVAGATAMVTLASKAPAVAPAMAKIGVQTDRLIRSLGRGLQPLFESFAGQFEKFVSFAESHENIFGGFVLTAGGLAGIAALSKFFGISVSGSLLAGLGYIAAITSAGVGLEKVASILVDKGYDKLGLNDTPISETQLTAGGVSSLVQDEITSGISGRPSRSDIIKERDRISRAGFQPTPGASINADTDRRWSLLNWWDQVWS